MAAGRLYTGPCFVKYNGVLRGCHPKANARLRHELVRLCADDATLGRHERAVAAADAAEAAACLAACNRYTTYLRETARTVAFRHSCRSR